MGNFNKNSDFVTFDAGEVINAGADLDDLCEPFHLMATCPQPLFLGREVFLDQKSCEGLDNPSNPAILVHNKGMRHSLNSCLNLNRDLR